MSKDHFNFLLDEIRDAITVDYMHSLSSTRGNEPICPETILAMGLQFCALPSTILDLADLFGVSTSSARPCVNMFLDAIDFNTTCEALQVQLPDANNYDALQELANKWSCKFTAFGLFPNCLGAIDGWLPRTEMPRDVSNQVDYFSGHYHCYGLNVQAMCDPDLAFLYLAIAAPGKVNDIRAFYRVDCAPSCTESSPGIARPVSDAIFSWHEKHISSKARSPTPSYWVYFPWP
jgi:hypothetical protein